LADGTNHTGKVIPLQNTAGLPLVSNSRIQFASLFQQGDEQALKFFFMEFHAALALFANRWVQNRSIAEEIASEAFVITWRMHRKLNNYYKIRAYLYKVVQRISLRTLNQERSRAQLSEKAQFSGITNETPFDYLVRNETYRLIHTSLKDLPPGSRRVLTMHYLEGKTTGQIASELHLSPSTIKTQKAQGLSALRKKLIRPLLILLLLSVQVFYAPL
jgi:RNA polymerase sigma-70 factor (ECF subfamily)